MAIAPAPSIAAMEVVFTPRAPMVIRMRKRVIRMLVSDVMKDARVGSVFFLSRNLEIERFTRLITQAPIMYITMAPRTFIPKSTKSWSKLLINALGSSAIS